MSQPATSTAAVSCIPMHVTLISHMGGDDSVVNAARVSFNKQITMPEDGVLTVPDRKLIQFLAKHGHWSPFAHCFLSFRVKAPIFVARQLAKHQVGFSWNEVSRRYVDDAPEMFLPDMETGWRKRHVSAKQGSSSETVVIDEGASAVVQACVDTYNDLLRRGVCPEQARMVLPQCTMTEWIWSGSLYAFARMCSLRIEAHAQVECRVIAEEIADLIRPLFPVAWEALVTLPSPPPPQTSSTAVLN
jgi:thymidylate synthase (FAD)